MAKTITHQVPEDETTPAMFGDKDHLQASQNRTFSQMIFEMLSEREPSEGELKLLDLILNLSIDHGPNSPSASKTIEEAKKGEGMGEAVGEGIEEINDAHGGAGKPLMEALYKINDGRLKIKEYVESTISEGKRIPGMGHRVYKQSFPFSIEKRKQSLPSSDGKEKDPRAQLIFEKALELGVGEEFIKLTKEIREELYKQSGKYLTVNIDGAIAAVLCGFGFDPKLGIAVFIIARTPGLCAHFVNSSGNF